jgi:SAM-dependent MidA family methyltransferase
VKTDPDISTLEGQLLQTIRDRGPITFAEFMEAALYHPDHGFYARSPVGEQGHFVTSPHLSPAFGELVARQVAECWDLLGRPEGFTIAELGAGDGTMAKRVLDTLAAVPRLGSARYVALERTPGQRSALQEEGLATAESLGELGAVHVVLANEVLDNVPFHRLRERDGDVVEVLVGADGGRLVEVEGEPPPEVLAALDRPLRPGEERPVSPVALRLVEEVARALPRGYAFLFDYGFTAEGPAPPVHAYRGHEVIADVLESPGSRDVTAAVDLDGAAAAARGAGLQVWGPVMQREALLALGYRMWVSGTRARQAEVETAGDHRAALRLYEARQRASILIDEGKLGGLSLLAFASDGLPPPVSVLGDREQGC